MIKRFCDRCGEEILEKTAYHTDIQLVSRRSNAITIAQSKTSWVTNGFMVCVPCYKVVENLFVKWKFGFNKKEKN